VPLFLDSKASRLIQMADMIAYWIFRYYQSGDARGYQLLQPSILRRSKAQVGLVSSVTKETEDRLAHTAAHKYPFPVPSK
jgi:hypothetical protein